MKDISFWGVLIGIAVSQSIAMIGATVLVICFIFIYGSSVLVAFVEYPSSIAITMVLTLCSVGVGGFATMLTSNKSYATTLLYGVITLLLNFFAMYAIDFKYGKGHEWMLIATGFCIVPFAMLGAYAYRKRAGF